MCAKILLLLCPLLAASANSASTFDQRQTGDLNVQVDLKDLRIIALMKDTKEEYVVSFSKNIDFVHPFKTSTVLINLHDEYSMSSGSSNFCKGFSQTKHD